MMEIVVKVPYVDNVVAHVKKHKTIYISFGVVAVAGITCSIVRGNIGQRSMGGATGQRSVANTASQFFSKNSTINIISVLEREGRGHPGWPVQNLETNRIFLSQKDAADAFGITRQILSGHINGKFPDANGLHFQRVNLDPL